MKKTNKTYVAHAAFALVAKELEAHAKPQAGFVRIQFGEESWLPRVYVALTKQVARVDLACFAPEIEGVRHLDEDEAFGNVAAQLDFEGRSEEEIVATFREVMVHLRDVATPAAREARERAEAERAMAKAERAERKAKAGRDVFLKLYGG
jgi:hypothetical protein